MRSAVILEILAENDDPVRGGVLWKQANMDDRFRKVDGSAFWYEDFPWYMHSLEDQGLVTKIKERNKVWYVITEKGLQRHMKRNEPKLLQRHVKGRLKYNIERNAHYQSDEREQTIAQLARKLKDGDKYVRQRYYRELVDDTARRREWGRTSSDEELLELVTSKVGQIDEEKFNADVQKLVEQWRRRVEEQQGFYAECFKCGRSIHRHEAVKVADKLAERLGIETATVCCGCYDKLMGGESEVEANTGV